MCKDFDTFCFKKTSFTGTKVVRGPNWRWGNKDGGEGNVGMVYFPVKCLSPKLVLVNWRNGGITKCRMGYGNQYDLRIVDNSQDGVIHQNISCNSCNVKSIAGMRYECKTCESWNLCSPCYHSGKHSLRHIFLLFATQKWSGVQLPRRIDAECVLRPKYKYYKDHLPVLGKTEADYPKQSSGVRGNLRSPSLTVNAKCAICSEARQQNVRFVPCNHKITCENCCTRFKKCMACDALVEKRITNDGRVLYTQDQIRVQKLEDRLKEVLKVKYCGCCTRIKSNVKLACGHKICLQCVRVLSTCYSCHEHIDRNNYIIF